MILIIDNLGQYVHRIKTTLRDIDVRAEIVANTINVDEILKKSPDGIILSGGSNSAWEEKEIGNCRKILDTNFPILGICLGHQII
ncbi:MAG: GMP synthase, partial [Candidatus Altiarchaeales archaeon A3]